MLTEKEIDELMEMVGEMQEDGIVVGPRHLTESELDEMMEVYYKDKMME